MPFITPVCTVPPWLGDPCPCDPNTPRILPIPEDDTPRIPAFPPSEQATPSKGRRWGQRPLEGRL